MREEDRREPLILDRFGVPRNPIVGDGTLLYRSMDCLQRNKTRCQNFLQRENPMEEQRKREMIADENRGK